MSVGSIRTKEEIRALDVERARNEQRLHREMEYKESPLTIRRRVIDSFYDLVNYVCRTPIWLK